MQAAVSRERTHPDRRAPESKEVFFAGGCAALVSAIYVALAAWHGALGAARSDDWAYYRAAFALARDGSFSADPWSFTMLVGHLVLAQPVIRIFGSSIAALQLLVAALSAVALTATYLVARSYLSRGPAAFAVGCLALGPIYGSLSVSYMTDIPAFLFEVLVLWTGLQALRTNRFSYRWFIVSLSLGIVAFSIREYALAAPAAVSLVVLRRVAANERSKMKYAAILVSLGLTVAAGMYLWRHSLTGVSHVARPNQSILVSTAYVSSALLTIALFAFPMLLLISVRASVSKIRPRLGLIVSGVIVLIWALLAANGAALTGNWLTAHGSYPETLPGDPPVVLPTMIWQALQIISLCGLLLFAAVVLTLHKGRRGIETARVYSPAHSAGLQLSWVFCLVMFGELAVVKFTTPGVITDRYLITIVPFAIAAIFHYVAERGLLVRHFHSVAIVSLTMLALLGTMVVDAAATFDGAKWQFATSVQRRGVAPELIDGGYEWYGYHQPGKIIDFELDAPARNWWNRLFDTRTTCVEIRHMATLPATVTRTDGDIVDRFSARTLFGVNYDLVAIRTAESCPIAEAAAASVTS